MKVCKFVNAASVLHILCVLTNTPLLLDRAVQFANNNVNEEPPEEFEDDDDPDDPIGRKQLLLLLPLAIECVRK